MADWSRECLKSISQPAEDDKLCYEMFCKYFITSGASHFDDDILYFVNEDTKADPCLVVRRMPADGSMPRLTFKPSWRQTLGLNVITHIVITLFVELVSSDGAVKMSHSIPVYPSPIDHDIFTNEKKCSEKVLFPQIIIPIPGASIENKRLPVQRDEKLRLSIQGNGQKIFRDEISFGMISSELCKVYRKHKTGRKPGFDADQSLTFKRANGGLIMLNVAPFFFEGYRMGVRSAIYSLFLNKFPQSPDRFICKAVSITMHWNDIVCALRNNIKDSGS